MLTFYPIVSKKEIERTNPLHVSAFFSLTRMHWKKRKQRQGLILSIASGWWQVANKHISAPGFITKDFYLTSLSAQDKESRKVLEYFFTIEQKGFNLGNGTKQSSKIKPNKLPGAMVTAIINFLQDAEYNPGPKPTDKNITVSAVKIKCKNHKALLRKLVTEDKEHLLPAVKWLLEQQGTIDFYFEPAGSLKARNKSVWPIKSIETWPGWLRTELFGTVIDIENSYIQFLLKRLEEKYIKDYHKMCLMYPDIIKMYKHKTQFRNDLCKNYFHLPPTKPNIKYIKNVLMSISNGSRISGKMVQTFNTNSDAVKIILEANRDLTSEQMFELGERLNVISRQLKSAKKDLCRSLGLKGTAEDQKKIFQEYLQWERQSRYKIWDAVNQTGLHLHDGLDGIESNMSEKDLIKYIEKETGIKVSVEEPEYN